MSLRADFQRIKAVIREAPFASIGKGVYWDVVYSNKRTLLR